MPGLAAMLQRLTGALRPDLALRLGAQGPPQAARGERGLILRGRRGVGRIEHSPPVELLLQCSFDGAELAPAELLGEISLCSFSDSTLEQPQAVAGSSARACRAERLQLLQPQLSELQVSASGLRDMRCEGGELPRFTACDLSGARLGDARLAQARACDLSYSRLERCDLRGADLRGSVLRGAELRDCQLDGLQVQGADLRGVRGLSPEQRRQLLRAGAHMANPATLSLLARLQPASDPLLRHRLARALSGLSLLALVAVVALSVGLSLKPPPAPAPPPIPAALARPATPQERDRTQQGLQRLRAGLQAAHEELERRGASPAWPNLYELQENRYDVDGSGPETETALVVTGGLPDNALTSTVGGVLEYCNEVPTQETITGVDTDWHYCPQTGRVLAAAGFTQEPTLGW